MSTTYQKRIQAGRCGRCGDRLDGLSRSSCRACLARTRAWRRRHGVREWKPGGVGRRPFDYRQRAAVAS